MPLQCSCSRKLLCCTKVCPHLKTVEIFFLGKQKVLLSGAFGGGSKRAIVQQPITRCHAFQGKKNHSGNLRWSQDNEWANPSKKRSTFNQIACTTHRDRTQHRQLPLLTLLIGFLSSTGSDLSAQPKKPPDQKSTKTQTLLKTCTEAAATRLRCATRATSVASADRLNVAWVTSFAPARFAWAVTWAEWAPTLVAAVASEPLSELCKFFLGKQNSPDLSPSCRSSRSRVNLFYGHSQQLGGQVRIKVEHAQLVIKLIDHGGLGGGGGSVSLGPGKGSLTLTNVDLLEVKVKRGGGGGLPLGGGSWGDSARVQFKLKPGTLYAHQVRLGLLDGGRVQEAAVRRLEEAQGNVGKLEVHFAPETMASLVEEMVVSRFLRKVRYGFLRLRTMLVPSKWYWT